MNKVQDYIVIAEQTKEKLRQSVLIKLEEGYVLQGGVSMGTSPFGNVSQYYQAIVLYKS